ncbi:MAG TPA: CehA/McbA family metallohydrolase [Polyangiaceae bacterium]|nr:CehA/McbA family metallohydrolase [Polyangiaceae bacterium]
MRARKVWQSELLPISLGLGALVAALLFSANPAESAVARLAPRETGERLRVFGAAGDPKLENGEATAIIRSVDGALVDFFRRRAFLPTIDQLDTVADVDGLWEVVPMMHLFGSSNTVAVPAKRVGLVADGVEAVGEITLGGARIEAQTTYRIDATRPLLRIVTTFRLLSGYWPKDLGYGHTVRWGNVSYFVEGAGEKTHYAGHARWVGRRGAGGDLVLKNRSDMWVQFAQRIPGFHGALITVDRPGNVGSSYTVERELSYEDLPQPAQTTPAQKPGHLIVRLRDELGHPLPAKLRIRRDGRAEPLFSDQGGLDGVNNFIWTGNGTIDRELPPGKYRALATSGIERSAASFRFELTSGSTRVLQGELKRVVPTPGFISADLHLHQVPSVDADISLENRVVSVAAEGVELAVATDHYTVTDLAPVVSFLRERGILSAPLATIAGSEVSTLGTPRFGHFNVFPLDQGEIVRYRDVTPSELFADARQKSPNGVIQVNHPRWDAKLGYFTHYGLTLDTAEPKQPGYDPNFDTLEVYNGDDARDINLVLPPLMDWIHLLGRGYRYTATGSSDSHNLAFLDPGLPRTYIRHGVGSDDASDVQAPADAVIKALKAGHVIVSSGPFIEASVQGKGPGETARGIGQYAELKIRVRAAPWVSVSKLEVYHGGSAKLVHSSQIWPSQKPVRYDAIHSIPIEKPTFFVVVVRGDVPLPNVARDTTLPFAFTNPIWVEP